MTDKPPYPITDEHDLYNPRPVVESEQPEEKTERNWFLSNRKLVIAMAGVALVTAIGGGVAVKALNQKQPTTTEVPSKPNQTPATSTETSTTTSETSTADIEKSPEALISSLEIPAGLDSEALAKIVLTDRLTQWVNAGVYTESDANIFHEAWLAAAGTTRGFADSTAKKYGEIFADALFVLEWRQSSELTRQEAIHEDMNADNLENYMLTAWNGGEHPENIEGYKRWYTIESVKELSNKDGERTLEIYFKENENTDMNNVPPMPEITTHGIWTVTFHEIDGIEKISAISVNSQ